MEAIMTAHFFDHDRLDVYRLWIEYVASAFDASRSLIGQDNVNDWEHFIESIPWFADAGAKVHVSEPREGLELPSSVASVFPTLAHLLAQSQVTPVAVDDVAYQLVAWDTSDEQRMGWLCLMPKADIPNDIHANHTELLNSFGGIIERFNEPDDTWLLNHNDALTGREALHDAGFINDYAWAFSDAGVDLPIRLIDYYSLAREANGNTTLCHRKTGHILLFAPDHAFNFVVLHDKKSFKSMLHSVAAWNAENRVVLRSQSVDQTSNEITAIPELFKKLELKGAIITMDALWNQKGIAAQIAEGGGDYVLAIKDNHPTLHKAMSEQRGTKTIS
jgi:hypothetical protein